MNLFLLISLSALVFSRAHGMEPEELEIFNDALFDDAPYEELDRSNIDQHLAQARKKLNIIERDITRAKSTNDQESLNRCYTRQQLALNTLNFLLNQRTKFNRMHEQQIVISNSQASL